MVYVISAIITVIVVTVMWSFITTVKVRRIKKSHEEWINNENRRVYEKLSTIGNPHLV